MSQFDHFDAAPDNPGKQAVLSVSSLNRLARSLLEGHFPAVTVEGEISNLAQPSSGHWYLTLKDSKSQLRCAMFANRNRATRFRPDNGQQVIVRGKLSIYEGRGDYQLIIDSMEEAGDGALRRAFEELKAKLQAEGLFAAEHKQEIHDGFRHIGLITSGTGAAIRDLLSVFARRFPAIKLTLLPVSVQGQNAAAEIAAAITTANRLKDKLGLEALIVGRGGGSLEDLQAFNEEIVARAIFASTLPVTSAVGHEVDFTIADFVADLRAPTPSAAAEIMSPSQGDYQQHFLAYRQMFAQAIARILQQQRLKLDAIQRHLKRPDRRLQERAQMLDSLESRLLRAQRHVIERCDNRIARLARSLFALSPKQQLQRTRSDLERMRHALVLSMKQQLRSGESRLANLGRNLHTVSPLSTLARGYSIIYDASGEVLRSISAVKPGDKINSRLHDGFIEAIVDNSHPSAHSQTDD
jgi:exodeoxyribonuclease VII large subunit